MRKTSKGGRLMPIIYCETCGYPLGVKTEKGTVMNGICPGCAEKEAKFRRRMRCLGFVDNVARL